MAMKRLSGAQKFVGKGLKQVLEEIAAQDHVGAVGYFGDGDSTGLPSDVGVPPDVRVAHGDQWWRIPVVPATQKADVNRIISAPFTITVHHDPAEGADYLSIKEALRFLAGFWKPPEFTEVYVTVLIKSGHRVKDQTFLSGVDMSWVILLSEDNDVVVEDAALTQDPFGGGGTGVFEFSNLYLPIIEAHFVSDGSVQPNGASTFGLSTGANSRWTFHPSKSRHDLDLNGTPGKRYGFSGFDRNVNVGSWTSAFVTNAFKCTDSYRDGNVSIGSYAGMAMTGGDYTGYRAQMGILVSGQLSIGGIQGGTQRPGETYGPGGQDPATQTAWFAPDCRKDAAGDRSGPHDIRVQGNGLFTQRVGFIGTCNLAPNETRVGWGTRLWRERATPSEASSDMLSLRPYLKPENLPSAELYPHSFARVVDGGDGKPLLLMSDNGEWVPIATGALSTPTYTDNGDGTYTIG